MVYYQILLFLKVTCGISKGVGHGDGGQKFWFNPEFSPQSSVGAGDGNSNPGVFRAAHPSKEQSQKVQNGSWWKVLAVPSPRRALGQKSRFYLDFSPQSSVDAPTPLLLIPFAAPGSKLIFVIFVILGALLLFSPCLSPSFKIWIFHFNSDCGLWCIYIVLN